MVCTLSWHELRFVQSIPNTALRQRCQRMSERQEQEMNGGEEGKESELKRQKKDLGKWNNGKKDLAH